ncbi:MAG TPA: CARDB domain-containing protein, partial [Armatimonadota bacterium]|nr:CARDB domain-containing protein [Armatimonadota bacterium]
MRRLALVALVLSTTIAAHAQNSVTNGGFEIANDAGGPADWNTMGDVTISDDAHSGEKAVLLSRDSVDLECGLNREWEPDSGEQGTMLSELKGGLRFWYKALDASEDAWMRFYVIPMSDRPMEDTGEMRTDFMIPAGHVGDGKWHVGIVGYNFSANEDVKWVHLSPRIAGESASLLLDDVEWMPEVGPALSVATTRWEEDEKRPGERATLTVRVRNNGDRPAANAAVTVTCPDGLRVADGPTATIPGIAVDDTEVVSFDILGRRDEASAIEVAIDVAESIGEAPQLSIPIEPKMEIIQLRASPFILAPGQTATIEAVVRGNGSAICTGITGELSLLAESDFVKIIRTPRKPIEVRPGQEVSVTWRVKALQPALDPVSLSATIAGSNAEGGDASTTLVLAPKPVVAPDVPGAHVEEDVAWLQGDDIRLVIQRAAAGFGIGDVQVRKAGKWTTVARMPSLGRAVASRRSSSDSVRWIAGGEVRADGDALMVEAQPNITDLEFTHSVTFTLRDDGKNIGVTSSLTAAQTCDLYAFDMPFMYVGEGSFGGKKTEALFPGCDWLDSDDISSEYEGKLIERGHKHQVRYVPDPNMITIPLMSVHHEGTTVGLMWDHNQSWDGWHDRPAAAFASPDRFE